MKNIYFIFIFFIGFSLNCQPSVIKGKSKSTGKELSKEDFEYACGAYKKMIESPAYLEHEKQVRLFAKKTNNQLKLENFHQYDSREKLLIWLEKNLSKTQFKTIDEAKLLIETMKKASEKMINENKKLYELMSNASLEQLNEIHQPFFNRVRSESGL